MPFAGARQGQCGQVFVERGDPVGECSAMGSEENRSFVFCKNTEKSKIVLDN